MGDRVSSTNCLCGVISSAYQYIDMPKEKLLDIALKDIQKVFADSKKAKLIHSKCIKERRATFSATPEVERFRSSTETPIRNFFIAGDWTGTGLPATIEGAVISGFKAAKMVEQS